MDNRRIQGPDQSSSYYIYSKTNKLQNFVTSCREDGRKSEELRKIYIKTNVVSQAKGSAYIELGETKVIVSVFDPREIPNKNEYSLLGELYCEFKFAPFSCIQRRNPQPDSQEKEYSAIFKRALESVVCRPEFPNFQVDIFALVLQNDGCALSAAVSGAGVALAQAGVPMYDLISCVTIGFHGGQIYVDPTSDEEDFCNMPLESINLTYKDLKLHGNKTSEVNDEENKNEQDTAVKMDVIEKKSDIEHGLLTISLLHTHQQISEYYQNGSMSLETLKKLTNLLIEKNNEMIPLLQNCLIKYVNYQLKNKKI